MASLTLRRLPDLKNIILDSSRNIIFTSSLKIKQTLTFKKVFVYFIAI